MTDRRFLAANARVAAAGLEGKITGVRFVTPLPMTVAVPVLDLCASPAGARDRQLLFGETVGQLEDHDGWSFVQSTDGYVGYVTTAALTSKTEATHRVATFATHGYSLEDFKSPERIALNFGAKVTVLDERRKFFETTCGFIPKRHLRPLDRPFEDPATIAQLHFGVPYLWGGNSTSGIDCSGLVAAALQACDIPCPADSDLQRQALGQDIAPEQNLQRGDLIFWQGHVGMMVDAETLIHANAHHMACTYEPLTQAIQRIAAQGDGEVLARRRIS